jgi:hypothetical protein
MEMKIISVVDFSEYLRGKTIAVVANSSKLLEYEYGELIDGHDIVIRFNAFRIIPKHTGTKTSVHATIFLPVDCYDAYCDYRVVYSPDHASWERGLLNILPDKQRGVLNYIDTPTTELFDGYPPSPMAPSTGFYILSLLDKLCDSEKINLIGFTFYENGVNDLFRLNPNVTEIYDKHAYTYEREWVNKRYTSQTTDENIKTRCPKK